MNYAINNEKQKSSFKECPVCGKIHKMEGFKVKIKNGKRIVECGNKLTISYPYFIC